MRRFQLHRIEDASGVSGTGVVAQGIEFDDGHCAMRWLTATASTAFYATVADLETIHGHEGRTKVVWLDSGGVSEITPDCGCDFVQTVGGPGNQIEIHHVMPDDGAPHAESLECGCGPQVHIKRADEDGQIDLVVADHVDQDLIDTTAD